METLIGRVGSDLAASVDVSELVAAARWHDTGKVHPAFQVMLTAGLPVDDSRRAGGPWAKSDGKYLSRNGRAGSFVTNSRARSRGLAIEQVRSWGLSCCRAPREGSSVVASTSRRGTTNRQNGGAVCAWRP